MPMELILLASGLNTLLPRIWEHRKDQKRKKAYIDANLKAIKILSVRLLRAIEDPKFNGDGSTTHQNLKYDARLLSQNTLDSIQLFFSDKNPSNTEFEVKTTNLREALTDLCKRIENYKPEEEATKKPEDPCATKHMAMEETMEDVLELIKPPSDGGPKVISIVGFPGLGKTIIAKQVYAKYRAMHPSTVGASVTAAANDASKVITEILEEIDAHDEHETLGLEKPNLAKPKREKPSDRLTDRLQGERYFIVIDDMQTTEQWNNMKYVFPDGDGTIIVTTSMQSVANVCSALKGYVYKLSPLDDRKSLDLFIRERTSWGYYANEAKDILKICDGLPLAIDSMSNILEATPMGLPTGEACSSLCAALGTYLLKGHGSLERMQWVLMNKYTGLNCDALRSCLLYYCLYKHNIDAVPRRNSLTRRWEAEGFLVARNPDIRTSWDVAAENLNLLVDRNIMQSMEVGKNGSTRRCRPPGMMLEYISSLSKYENFAASVSDAVPSGIRRLSFYHGNARNVKGLSDEDLMSVLTLEVSGIGCEAILDFKKYELIAVLELKECTNLESSHVKDIWKLLLLKYLSLGNSIGKIPRDIKKLVLLETLEMRTTETVEVCKEILYLPNLKHLIGNFQLIDKLDKDLKKFLSKPSALQTITGFVTTTTRGFPQLMQHMKGLRKVKIFLTDESNDKQCTEDREVLPTAINGFLGEGLTMATTRHSYSLSVDFAGCTSAPLEFLQYSGSLTSLKLRGKLGSSLRSPHFTQITGISKLCLSSTGLTGEAVLAGLTNFGVLQYLKLEGDELEPIVINKGNFGSLIRLCIVSKQRQKVLKIEAQALPRLVSFHLICTDIGAGLQTSIKGLNSLKEIALQSGVSKETINAWKAEARRLPNMPDVQLIQDGAPIRKA